MDALEGYADGLSGKAGQVRQSESAFGGWSDYVCGYWLGSDDRKTMLHRHAATRFDDAFAKFMHGLADAFENSTAGDVMQPVERDLWADGMGDGNG